MLIKANFIISFNPQTLRMRSTVHGSVASAASRTGGNAAPGRQNSCAREQNSNTTFFWAVKKKYKVKSKGENETEEKKELSSCSQDECSYYI